MNQLKKISLFANVRDGDAEKLQSRCNFRTYESNELVIDYDEESSDVRFIISGRVRVLLRTPSGKEVNLTELGPGEFFGEMAAIDGSSRSANVTALDRSQVCVMPASVFLHAAAEIPEVGLQVMRLLCDRVRELNVRLGEHAFLTARQRLCAELLRQSKPRMQDPDQRIVSPPPLQKDMADRIGTQREVVTRELSALRKTGVIEATKGGLVIVDPVRLNDLISEALKK